MVLTCATRLECGSSSYRLGMRSRQRQQWNAEVPTTADVAQIRIQCIERRQLRGRTPRRLRRSLWLRPTAALRCPSGRMRAARGRKKEKICYLLAGGVRFQIRSDRTIGPQQSEPDEGSGFLNSSPLRGERVAAMRRRVRGHFRALDDQLPARTIAVSVIHPSDEERRSRHPSTPFRGSQRAICGMDGLQHLSGVATLPSGLSFGVWMLCWFRDAQEGRRAGVG
jgi:hypothetical protein